MDAELSCWMNNDDDDGDSLLSFGMSDSLMVIPGLHGGAVGADVEWGGECGAGPSADGAEWQPPSHHSAPPPLPLYAHLHLHCSHSGG